MTTNPDSKTKKKPAQTTKSKTAKKETAAKKPKVSPAEVAKVSEPANGITWGGWAAVIASVIIYFAATFIAAEIIAIYPALKGWDHKHAVNWLDKNNFAQFFFVVIFEALTVGLIFAFIRWRKGNVKAIGLEKPQRKDRTIGNTLLGFIVYFPAYLVIIWALTKFINLNVNQQQNVGFSSSTSGLQIFLIFISLCVLVPIAEEIMFRGFLYSGLKKSMPLKWAALLTSVIFAFPHMLEGTHGGLLWDAGVDVFILSLVLIWLRERTGKLYAGMGLHALKNFVAFAFVFLFNIH